MHHGTEFSHPSDIFNNVSFICFNYDRCIEHFFCNAVGAYTNHESDTVAQVVNAGLNIVHPYGKIGRLPWQTGEGNAQAVSFGDADYDPRALVQVGRGLKTFTEQVEDHDETMLSAKAMIQGAQSIVFLGFSFLEQNMAYISPAMKGQAATVYATLFGESPSNQDLSIQDVKKMMRGPDYVGHGDSFIVTQEVMKAGNFIQNYGRRLRM